MNVRGPTLWAWETVRPNVVFFPQISQALAITLSVSPALDRTSQEPQDPIGTPTGCQEAGPGYGPALPGSPGSDDRGLPRRNDDAKPLLGLVAFRLSASILDPRGHSDKCKTPI